MPRNPLRSRGWFGSQEVKHSFSRKLFNRCINAFDSSQLVLVGGEYAGQKAKSRQLKPYLETASLDGIRGDSQLALPALYQALLLNEKSTLEETYIYGLGGYDFDVIPQFGIHSLAPDFQPVIRTVFGATQEMPLRGLSYILPALIYADSVQKAGVNTPQVQIIFANHISGSMNGFAYSRVHDESERFVVVASDYVQQFFPHLRSSLVFLEDTPLSQESIVTATLEQITDTFQKSADDELKNTLSEKAEKHGSEDTAFAYGAAHMLFHDMHLPESIVPFDRNQPEVATPHAIINIGGYQEEFFYNLRYRIKPHLTLDYQTLPTIQFFTHHFVPPYYMARGGDIRLRDALEGSSIAATIAATARHDLDYLYKVSNARGDLEAFFDEQRRKAA